MRSLLCITGNLLSLLYAKVLLIMVVQRTNHIFAGPKIFVVNHPNTLDPFYLLGILGEHVSILITEHVFHIPILGRLVRRAGHIQVTKHGRDVYDRTKKALLDGKSLLLFAEGEISYSPSKLRKFHTGAVRLSLETGAPIIPIGIHLDAHRIWKKKTMIKNNPLVVTWYRYGWYTVVFGDPLYIYGLSTNRSFVRSKTVDLRRQVISCILKAKQKGIEDRLLHKRQVKIGLYTGFRCMYRFVCFLLFVYYRIHNLGVQVFG